jgi:hypothetical protein
VWRVLSTGETVARLGFIHRVDVLSVPPEGRLLPRAQALWQALASQGVPLPAPAEVWAALQEGGGGGSCGGGGVECADAASSSAVTVNGCDVDGCSSSCSSAVASPWGLDAAGGRLLPDPLRGLHSAALPPSLRFALRADGAADLRRIAQQQVASSAADLVRPVAASAAAAVGAAGACSGGGGGSANAGGLPDMDVGGLLEGASPALLQRLGAWTALRCLPVPRNSVLSKYVKGSLLLGAAAAAGGGGEGDGADWEEPAAGGRPKKGAAGAASKRSKAAAGEEDEEGGAGSVPGAVAAAGGTVSGAKRKQPLAGPSDAGLRSAAAAGASGGGGAAGGTAAKKPRKEAAAATEAGGPESVADSDPAAEAAAEAALVARVAACRGDSAALTRACDIKSLKAFLKSVHERVGGTKPQLVERVAAYCAARSGSAGTD